MESYRNEDGIENGPYYVEAPTQVSDSGRCNLHDDIIGYPSKLKVCHILYNKKERSYQLDAVPTAAPLVLIERLLISVGYNQGTPSKVVNIVPRKRHLIVALTCQQIPKNT